MGTPAAGGNVEWAAGRGAPRLTLLSPGPQQWQDLYKVWEKELEHRGASVLLCADAFPTVLVPALKALVAQRGLHGPLAVDAIKLSHHGSRAKVSTDLLATVKAPQHIVSTNNAIFKHPSEEAVARVVLSGDEPTLWFNHDTEQNRRRDSAALKAQHGYQVRYPAPAGEGVTLELPARPRR